MSNSERYPQKEGDFSSHRQLARLLGDGRGRRLLDVGCAQGALGAELARQGWEVVGVEPDPHDAARARALGLVVVNGTMESAGDELVGEFECVVFADVLEHMTAPETALDRARRLLSPGGFVVASIPNIAHLAVRLQLMGGSFTYSDRGPLDRTHVRFFTRRTARELFDGAGYQVIAVQLTPAPIEMLAPMMRLESIPHGIQRLNRLSSAIWPGGLAYQFLVLARPRPETLSR